MMERIGSPQQFTTGQRNIAVTWTPLRLLTYSLSQHGVSVQDTKIILRWDWMVDHYQDQRHVDLIFHEQFARLQPSKMKKNGWTLTSRNTFESDNAQSTTNCDRILSGRVGTGISKKQLVAGLFLNFDRLVVVRKMARAARKRMARTTMVARVERVKYSLSESSVILQDSSAFIRIFNFADRQWRTSCKRRWVWTEHLTVRNEHVPHTHIFSRTRDTLPTHTRWLNMCVLCCVLSFLESHSISSMFHHATLDAQLSSLFPTPFPAQTPSLMTTLSLLFPFDEFNPCRSATTVALWPLGRTKPSHRLWAQDPHRSQQRAHSDQLAFQKRQARHGPQPSRDDGCVWNRHDRSGTVDFATVFSGARSKC